MILRRGYTPLPMGHHRFGLCWPQSSLPYYIFAFFFLVVLFRFFSDLRDAGLSSPTGLRIFKGLDVIKPGDFFDAVHHQQPKDGSETGDVYDGGGFGRAHDIRNEKFYIGGTLSLTAHNSRGQVHPTSMPYDPYPAYNSQSWRKSGKGTYRPCVGPRGNYLDRRHPHDAVSVYKGNQKNFPFPTFGSYEAMHLDGEVCVDRYSRYGPYGYDEDNDETVPGFDRPPKVSWDKVDWKNLQSQCLERNNDRYNPTQLTRSEDQPPLAIHSPQTAGSMKISDAPASPSIYQSRSAVVIRTWHNMTWTQNDIHYVRSMIMELSLHSGGEYEVFLLTHVRDAELPIFSDEEAVTSLKETFIPREFWNITLLFNDKLLEAWYPKIQEHRPVYQHLQPLQIFSQLHPNFEYYWQFEMDSRYIGHLYHFLDRAAAFAREQPRKHLWERNAYFYTPDAHGSWSDFKEMVDKSMTGQRSVWGPVALEEESIRPVGPNPPVADPKDDHYKWGVGEEADLITWLPIFDPSETKWTFPDKIWNFKQGLETPRRTAVITMSRLSKRLLDVMHHAQAVQGLGLVSEMSAPSWALYHGLKAVHVPHPIYLDGKWTGKELAGRFNSGAPGKVNGGKNSIWNWDHLLDHIIYRFSYMFTTHTAEDLFRHWMGYKSDDGHGGKEFEKEHGRPCLPPMFLHTIKNTAEEKGPEKAVPGGI